MNVPRRAFEFRYGIDKFRRVIEYTAFRRLAAEQKKEKNQSKFHRFQNARGALRESIVIRFK